MTVATVDPTKFPQRSVGNGVTTVFPFQYKILTKTDIKVYVAGILKTVDIDYSVTGFNSDAGGNVTFLTGAPANGASVIIMRSMAQKRTTDYQQLGDFQTTSVNPDFDNAVLLIQDLAEAVSRSLQSSVLDPLTSTTLTKSLFLGAYLAVNASGALYAASGTGNDTALRADLADGETAGKGSNLVGISKAQIEINAGVTVVNHVYNYGVAYRYGTNTTPGVTDMTTALQATINYCKAGGGEANWPEDTYLVSTINISGSNYRIRTAGGKGTLLQQKTGTDRFLGQIIRFTGSSVISGIKFGDLAFKGNIASDVAAFGTANNEYHHGIYIYDDAAAATISNIEFGDLYGTDLCGDVFYCNGLTARPVTGIKVGFISGTNIWRNYATFGGEGICAGVIHDGACGYRHFDFEPNIGGYQEPNWQINKVVGGAVQITSQDVNLGNIVTIGHCDLDFNRVLATTPAYPGAPGVNSAGFICNNSRYLKIGYLKMRNYNYIPFLGGTATIKSNIYIDHCDVSNCCITEAVYNSLFADQGTGGINYLEIGNLIATLTATTKMCFNGNGMAVRVRRGTVSGGLLAASIPGGQYENMTINMNGAAGNLLAACNDTILTNVALSNDTLATGMLNCQRNTWTNVTATFSALEGGGCAQNRLANCTIKGIKYTFDFSSGYFVTKAMADANQTLTAIEGTGRSFRCTGALTAQRNLVLNARPDIVLVDNSTTGGFGIQAIAPSGAGIVIAAGKKALVHFDGTNVVRATADV